MKNKLDSKFLLSVFDKVCKHGKAQDGVRMLEGVKAYTDHDGYTIFIEDALVRLSFGFHNQYHYDYESAEHLEMFEKKLQTIASQY